MSVLVRISASATLPGTFELPVIRTATMNVSRLPVARQLMALTSDRQ
jgi:hypothetical protein